MCVCVCFACVFPCDLSIHPSIHPVGAIFKKGVRVVQAVNSNVINRHSNTITTRLLDSTDHRSYFVLFIFITSTFFFSLCVRSHI